MSKLEPTRTSSDLTATEHMRRMLDERGNISVRVSRDVQVLTREEANRIEAEYKRMQAENAKLRELAAGIGHLLFPLDVDYCATCPRDDINHPCPVHTANGGECLYKTDMRELGMEVD